MHAYYIGCTNSSKSIVTALIVRGRKSTINSTEVAPGSSKSTDYKVGVQLQL